MPSNDLRMVLLHVYNCSNEELIQNINFVLAPQWCVQWVPGFSMQGLGYMSYSLNSLKGGYIGDDIWDYYRGLLRAILGV